jgi:serine/threonine protein kinase
MPTQSVNPSACGADVGQEVAPSDLDDTPTIELAESCADQPATDPIGAAAPSGGLLLGCRYLLEEELGRGGCSVVFRAKDLGRAPEVPERLVAVKLLRPEQGSSPWARARLTREFQQLQRLSHPGIVRVFDLSCDPDACFMSMELIAGQTVKRWMQSPRELSDVLKLIENCCTALAYAHSLGIVHGDLKPTNIIVTETGAAKLIDFGSAPSASSEGAARSDSSVAATPLYASPQQLAGKSAEPRDDVFGVACLMYFILTGGRHPFGGRPSLEDGRAKSAPTYLQAIPPNLFEVLKRALSAERERRPASVQEFLRASVAATAADARAAAMRGRSSTARDVRTSREAAGGNDLVTVGDTLKSDRQKLPLRAWFAGSLITLVTAMAAATLGLRTDAQPPDTRAGGPWPRISAPSLERTARESPPAAAIPAAAKVSQPVSGFVSFETSTVDASAAQSLVAITVKRSKPISSSGAFVWRVRGGSARPGVDYEQVRPQIARFNEGQTIRTLFVPLLNTGTQGMAARIPRSFTVVLESMAGGPALGRFARITVRIDPLPDPLRGGMYQVRAD